MVTSSEITSSSNDANLPFENLTFMFNDRAHGRILLRIAKADGNAVAKPGPFDEEFDFSAVGVEPDEAEGSKVSADIAYDFHYEVGAAGRDQQDDIKLTLEQVAKLQQQLVDAGVYLWEPEYGDASDGAPSRWNLTIVLKKDVFTQTSRGGSDYPEGFSKMLDAFHAIGLPNPGQARSQQQGNPFQNMGGAGFNAAGMPNFNPANFNPNDMFGAMQEMLKSGAPQQAMQQMQEAMNQLRDNPQAFQERLRSEFRSLTPQQQDELLNMLGSTGMVSREWWENFFRG